MTAQQTGDDATRHHTKEETLTAIWALLSHVKYKMDELWDHVEELESGANDAVRASSRREQEAGD